MKNKFASFMSLVKMQLSERLNISINKNNIKETLMKASLFLILLALATGFIFLLLYIFGLIGIFGIGGSIPVSLFNVIFYLILIIETISCISRFTDSLFFSKDNMFLLTYPVGTNTVFLSKIVVFYLLELIRNIIMFIPLFIAYGISCGVVWYYYLWLIVAFIIITLVPIGIASIVSIIYMYIKVALKKYVLIKGFVIIVLLGGLAFLLYSLINSIPEDLKLSVKWATVYYPAIINYSKALENYLFLFNFLPKIVFNYTFGSTNALRYLNICGYESILVALATLVGCALIIFLSSFIVKPLFIKMASSAYEHNSEQVKIADTKNTKRNALFSLIYKDVLLDFRTPSRLVSNFLLFIATPLATLLLNVVFKAIHTSINGQYIVLAVNYLLIILITCSTNISIASIYSREGAANYINKTTPLPYSLMLSSKLFVRSFLMVTSIILSIIIYHSKLSIAYSRFDLVLLSFLFIYLGHMFWSAELDFRHPKTNLYRDVGTKGNVFNQNELMSFIYAFILAIITALIAFLMESENIINGYMHIFVFCLLFFVGRTILFYASIKGLNNKIGN